MDAKELMIGDWVLSFPDQCKVDGVICLREEHTAEEKWMVILHIGGNKYQQVNVGILEPIPLTPEILEKNYGKETQVGISDKPCWGEMGAIWSTMLWKCENSFWLEVSTITGGFVKKHIRYVHELQHALRLAGIKKEIVL